MDCKLVGSLTRRAWVCSGTSSCICLISTGNWICRRLVKPGGKGWGVGHETIALDGFRAVQEGEGDLLSICLKVKWCKGALCSRVFTSNLLNSESLFRHDPCIYPVWCSQSMTLVVAFSAASRSFNVTACNKSAYIFDAYLMLLVVSITSAARFECCRGRLLNSF
jgi:hypothetical protein